MVILEKKTEFGTVHYIIEKGNVYRKFQEEIILMPDLKNLCMYTSLSNSYPSNIDFQVASMLEKVGFGTIIFDNSNAINDVTF